MNAHGRQRGFAAEGAVLPLACSSVPLHACHAMQVTRGCRQGAWREGGGRSQGACAWQRDVLSEQPGAGRGRTSCCGEVLLRACRPFTVFCMVVMVKEASTGRLGVRGTRAPERCCR